MALISVLIPCHNAEPWLREAIRSVCAQTYRDIEILIYDDGSTDRSEEIIRQLAVNDRRIIAMGETTNRGLVHALNTMLDATHGAYIARMDGDDISLPHRFERQLRFIEDGNADLCGTWFQEFGGGIPRAVRWRVGAEEVRAAMLFQSAICHPTVMAKREVFEAFPYRDGYAFAEDYDLFARASARFRLANVPEVLLRYRRHQQQITRARLEKVNETADRVRAEALMAQGIEATAEERRTHNMIRASRSIRSMEDLEKVEAWLVKLFDRFQPTDAKRVIASQWTRAAVRAAPLGWAMWRKYRKSPLHAFMGTTAWSDFDMAVLAAIRLDYGSNAFEALRRFGLSA